MRNFTSYTIAAILATTLMAGPVLANDTGHHTKQDNPTYWAPESSVVTDKIVNEESADAEKQYLEQNAQDLLAPSAHRRGFEAEQK